MKVHVIGIGLIGGSFAAGIRKAYESAEITGSDASAENLGKAQRLGLIDRPETLDGIFEADVVIISVPVDVAPKILAEVLGKVSENTLVFDTGSTKAGICKSVETHPNRRNYLAVHPIAGTEFSGPEAAIPDLFNSKTNILCEVEKTAFRLQERALEIFQKLGMRIRYMDPAAHDRHIAYVSHLSHISSFMLGKTVLEKEKNERDIFDLAGSGFASTVRLAKSSPNMWAPIFKLNKENVLEILNGYIENLVHFRDLLQNDDFEAVFQEMERINHIKTILKGIR